ncbi:MAG TPA: ABC transporter permease [Gemmatimonadales bacterium]|nr:ABC transporter permease [Gemmatimonadales bacterium]
MRPDEELPLSRRLPVDEDVDRELAYHLAERERELVGQGMDRERARAEAQAAFGDVGKVGAECREITRRTRRAFRRAETVEGLRQDLVLAWRLLRKTPGFTFAAVLTLALGIGANAAIFSVVNQVLLKPLPYEAPEQLVDIVEAHKNGWGNVPWANMLDLRATSRSFQGMASYGSGAATALTSAGPLRIRQAVVSEDFFRIFHVTPMLGRLPVAEEHREGATPVAVVSESFWRAQLGSPADLTTQRIRTMRDYQVIGVLPRGFAFPANADIWVPLELLGPSLNRTAHNWSVVGRLEPGITVETVKRELDTLTARLAAQYQPDFDGTGAIVTPLQSQLTAASRSPLYLLLGASGLLLLAACTNLASSMLARGLARNREVAVRIAIGAGRLRIVRQLFTEATLLALLGCAAGLGLAAVLLRLLVSLAPPALDLAKVRLDGWVLLFTALVGMTTTVLIGLFPALRTSGAEPGLALREGGRTGHSPAERRIWSGLVIAEVALAATLLCGSGLLIRSLGRVLEVDPGFRSDRLLTVAMSLPTAVYEEDAKREQFWTRVLEAVRAIPGVEVAGLTSALPLGGDNSSGSFGIEGVPSGPAGYGPGGAGYRMVSDGYFTAMGIPLLAGRDFDQRDVAGSAPVVIVNQALVHQWFKDKDPIGHRIRLESGMDNQGDGWLTVVGVVGDVRHRALTQPPAPETYVPLRQRPTRSYSVVLTLKTRGDPAQLEPAVRQTLAAVGPDVVPLYATMRERLSASQTDRQFTATILSAFALVALLLAGVGIYGVVSYTAVQRTREMGIRLALGALPAQVRGLIHRGALGQVLLGLGVGLVIAFAATRLMRSLLYEVTTLDPLAFAGSAALLILVAFLASWYPAWRIARLDPMQTIRSE